MYFFMLFLGILGGVFFAVQGPVNSALGKQTGVFEASLISFFGGTLISLIIAIIFGNGDFSLLKNVKFWQILGGLYGVVNVCVTVAAIPVLGAALTLTIIMFGQILAGCLIDSFGFFDSQKTNFTIYKFWGILIFVIGIILIYFGSVKKSFCKNEEQESQNKIEKSKNNVKTLLMIVLSLIAGILGAMQSPTNGSLAKLVGNWESTFISFLMGTLTLFLIVLLINKGKLKPIKSVGVKPWMFIGGLYGVCGIFLNLYVVQFLETTILVSCSMIGQLSCGLFIDTFGLIRTEKRKINILRILGILVIALGIFVYGKI